MEQRPKVWSSRPPADKRRDGGSANDDERKEKLKVNLLKVRRLEADRYRLPVDRSSDLEGLILGSR